MRKIRIWITCLAFLLCTFVFCPAPVQAEQSGDFTYRILEDGTAEITGYTGESTARQVEIPKAVDGYAVTGIGDSAFLYGLPLLQSLTVPEGVTYIGDYAFEWIGMGTGGDLSIFLPDSLTSIGKYAFQGVWPMGNLTIEIPENVTSIGEYAFSTAKLRSVTIPKGLTSIEDGVFTNALFESVVIPEGITSIGYSAFAECASLESVTFPESLKSIGKEAFVTTALKEVEIPAGVQTIGEMALGYAGNQRKVKDFAIYGKMDTAAHIYAYDNGFAFYVGHGQCGDHLRWKLAYGGVLTISGTGDMWDYTRDAHPDWYGRGITTVVLEEGVTSLGDFAFYHAETLFDYKFYYIQQLTLPNSLTRIGEGAFSGCFSLTDLSIPEGVTSIGEAAFYWCPDLQHATMSDSVTDMGDSVFGNCRKLESVLLSKGLTSISKGTFDGCDGLLEIEIPDGVISIGDSAFSYCQRLPGIEIPDGVISIGNNAFNGCEAITQIRLPESVTSIGHYAFNFCKALESINLPEGISSIGSLTFADCESLTGIEIPDGVTSVGLGAFSGCSALAQVRLPESLTTIGRSAFRDCGMLTELVIPSGVTSIDNWAFGKSALQEITFSGPAPVFGEDVFLNVTATAYYNQDGTWTDEVKQDYGGTITWVGEEIEPKQFVLRIGKAEGAPGDGVELVVSVDENPGFDTAVFSLEYDKNTLELTGYKSLLTAGMVSADKDSVSLVFSKSGGMYTGDLVSLKFRILDDAADGSYEVSLGKTENYSPLDEKTVFTCHSGSISVTAPGVTTLTLDQTNITLPVLEKAMLHADTGGVPADLIWTSSDKTTASVDENGIVTAKKYGKAVITVSIPGTQLSAACEVQTLFWDVADSSKYYFKHVYWAADHTPAITKGYDLEYFAPEEECTREQMMTFLWRLAGEPTPTSTKNPFKDVKAGQYYYKAVLWGVEKGITNGYSSGPLAGMFGVGEACTREQAMTFLWRMADKPDPAATVNKFKDVKAGDYFYKAVLWASENKIANGYTSGEYAGMYGVGLPCLREHMVTFLSRYAEKF